MAILAQLSEHAWDAMGLWVCTMMQEAVYGPVEVSIRATTFFHAFDAPVCEWVVRLGSTCASGSKRGAVRGPCFALS